MKLNVSKALIQAGSDSLQFFSRLSGLGVAGFNSHLSGKDEEITVQEKNNLLADDTSDETGSFCHNQQPCVEPYKCNLAKCQVSNASIDLWFYLSSPS